MNPKEKSVRSQLHGCSLQNYPFINVFSISSSDKGRKASTNNYRMHGALCVKGIFLINFVKIIRTSGRIEIPAYVQSDKGKYNPPPRNLLLQKAKRQETSRTCSMMNGRVCTHLMVYALTYKLITLEIGRTNVIVVVNIKKARQEAQAQLSCC